MSLLPPQKPATPLGDLRYILLGDETVTKPLKHDEVPPYERSLESPFPVALACCSEEETARFAPLKAFVDAIAKRDLRSGEKIVAALDELSRNKSAGKILNYQSKFYPVLYGNKGHEGIYMKWADVYPHLEGQENPKVLKTQTLFIDALKTMVLRNGPLRNLHVEAQDLQDYEVSLDNIFQQGAKKKLKAPASSTTHKKSEGSSARTAVASHTFPPFPTSPPVRRATPLVAIPRSVPLFPPSSAVPAALTPSVSRTASPAPPAIVSHRAFCDHEACAHDVITLSSDSDAPSPRNRQPFTRHGSQGNAATPRAHQRRGAPDSDAMSISSDTSGANNSDDSSPAPPIYLKFRDINGGILGSTTVRPRKGGVVPSLGTEVDEFLDSWGFESALVHFIFDCATQDPAPRSLDEFAARTTEHLSRTEAAWLYKRMKLLLRPDGCRRIYAML